MDIQFPFSLNLPIVIGNIKLTCFITERLRGSGKECANAPHNHGDYELKYIASGKAHQKVANEERILKSGDIVLLHPGTYHFQNADEISDDLVQYSIRFSIKKPGENAPTSQKKSYAAITGLLDGIVYLHDDNFTLTPLFRKLTAEITEKKFGYLNYIQSTALLLTVEFLRLAGADGSKIFNFDELKHNGYWRGKLDHFMHARYMDDIKLSDLAESINVSERHASRLVIREYGMSYIAKLTQVRVEQAKYRLAYSKKDLLEISQECGFASYSYFATCFKKHVGMTPGDYRSSFEKGESLAYNKTENVGK